MGQVVALARRVNPPDSDETTQVQYPPRSGCYFGSYFIMGGENFNTGQPEEYLFGDNNDLTFLNTRPTPFPYPAPAASEPSKTLQSLVNIRRDTIKLVKNESGLYSMEFIIDTDATVNITVYQHTQEDVGGNSIAFTSPTSVSKTWEYRAEIGQKFYQPEFTLNPELYGPDMFTMLPGEHIPLVIHCTVGSTKHAHCVYAMFEKCSDGSFAVKVVKQKQMIDGVVFILQEIYGMEKDEGSGECVICMGSARDTMILPCRHLCLCNTCADSLRFQASSCPICRQSFRALLQIKALQKTLSIDGLGKGKPGDEGGYESVALVEFRTDTSSSSSHDTTLGIAMGSEVSVPITQSDIQPSLTASKQSDYRLQSPSIRTEASEEDEEEAHETMSSVKASMSTVEI